MRGRDNLLQVFSCFAWVFSGFSRKDGPPTIFGGHMFNMKIPGTVPNAWLICTRSRGGFPNGIFRVGIQGAREKPERLDKTVWWHMNAEIQTSYTRRWRKVGGWVEKNFLRIWNGFESSRTLRQAKLDEAKSESSSTSDQILHHSDYISLALPPFPYLILRWAFQAHRGIR